MVPLNHELKVRFLIRIFRVVLLFICQCSFLYSLTLFLRNSFNRISRFVILCQALFYIILFFRVTKCFFVTTNVIIASLSLVVNTKLFKFQDIFSHFKQHLLHQKGLKRNTSFLIPFLTSCISLSIRNITHPSYDIQPVHHHLHLTNQVSC